MSLRTSKYIIRSILNLCVSSKALFSFYVGIFGTIKMIYKYLIQKGLFVNVLNTMMTHITFNVDFHELDLQLL